MCSTLDYELIEQIAVDIYSAKSWADDIPFYKLLIHDIEYFSTLNIYVLVYFFLKHNTRLCWYKFQF